MRSPEKAGPKAVPHIFTPSAFPSLLLSIYSPFCPFSHSVSDLSVRPPFPLIYLPTHRSVHHSFIYSSILLSICLPVSPSPHPPSIHLPSSTAHSLLIQKPATISIYHAPDHLRGAQRGRHPEPNFTGWRGNGVPRLGNKGGVLGKQCPDGLWRGGTHLLGIPSL